MLTNYNTEKFDFYSMKAILILKVLCFLFSFCII